MISTALAMLLAMQASDTTRAARESFTRCLGTFVERSVHASKTLDQFHAEFPQACGTEQAAFRQAIITRDMASRSTRAGANEAADLEVEDARVNFNDRFEMALPAPQTATASPPPASAPSQPTVAAQPASQTTGHPAAQPH